MFEHRCFDTAFTLIRHLVRNHRHCIDTMLHLHLNVQFKRYTMSEVNAYTQM